MNTTLYTQDIWEAKENSKPEKGLAAFVTNKKGQIVALASNLEDAKLMSRSKDLLQIAEMFHDHMKGTKMEKTLPFMMVQQVLKKIGTI